MMRADVIRSAREITNRRLPDDLDGVCGALKVALSGALVVSNGYPHCILSEVPIYSETATTLALVNRIQIKCPRD